MAESTGGGGVLRELLALFAFGVDEQKQKETENRLGEFFDKVKNIGKAIAGAFAAYEIYEFAEAQAKAMGAIERTSIALGISTDKVQELQYASRSLGMDADHLLNLTGRLQVAQQAAANSSSSQAKAFAALGVSVKDTNGQFKAADELLADVAEGIAKTSDPSKQAALATQLFGRSGRELLPFLKRGREGLEEISKRYKELGGGYTRDAIEKSKELEESQADLNLTWTNTKSTISSILLPVVTRLMNWFAKGAIWIGKLIKETNIFQAALIVLGIAATAFAIKMAIANLPLLAMAAAFGIIVLAVDDIVTTLQGGNSVIKHFIDGVFGEGATTETVKQLKEIWKDIVSSIKEGWQWLKEHYDLLKKIVGLLPPVLAVRAVGAVVGEGRSILNQGNVDAENRVKATANLPASFGNLLPAGSTSTGDININLQLPPGSEVTREGAQQVAHHVRREIKGAIKDAHARKRVAAAQ